MPFLLLFSLKYLSANFVAFGAIFNNYLSSVFVIFVKIRMFRYQVIYIHSPNAVVVYDNEGALLFSLIAFTVIIFIQANMLIAVLKCRLYLSAKLVHQLALKVAEKSVSFLSISNLLLVHKLLNFFFEIMFFCSDIFLIGIILPQFISVVVIMNLNNNVS